MRLDTAWCSACLQVATIIQPMDRRLEHVSLNSSSESETQLALGDADSRENAPIPLWAYNIAQLGHIACEIGSIESSVFR